MAVAEASFKMSIDTMSDGLMALSGFDDSSSVAESITTPSITNIGWLVALRELIPRMRIEVDAPGVPELA